MSTSTKLYCLLYYCYTLATLVLSCCYSFVISEMGSEVSYNQWRSKGAGRCAPGSKILASIVNDNFRIYVNKKSNVINSGCNTTKSKEKAKF